MMRFYEIQVERAGKNVFRPSGQVRQASLGGGLAREIHEADTGTTSPNVRAGQDSPERQGNGFMSRWLAAAKVPLSDLDLRCVWTDCASQPAALHPERAETSPKAGDESSNAKGTADGLVPEAATQEVLQTRVSIGVETGARGHSRPRLIGMES